MTDLTDPPRGQKSGDRRRAIIKSALVEFAYILNHAEGAHEEDHANYHGLREASNELDRYIRKIEAG